MKKILFIVAFPKKLNSSARFRIELYEEILHQHQFVFDTKYFWSKKMYFLLYEKGNALLKFMGLIAGFFKRILLLTTIKKYDYIFILREATPIGPPIFEWICIKLFKKKVIYDFDDAIWVSQASKNNSIAKAVKASWKVKLICKWAYKVSVGSPYLYNYASKYSKNVILNPTCVDTVTMHNVIKDQNISTGKLLIGWTGSFSTLVHLNIIMDAIKELENKYDFYFLVIADQNPQLPIKSFVYKKWIEETEINDLAEINIGIMPLHDDEYARGKCGFKLIQFMSLGIPVLASPVGVNSLIIDEGVNGFLCITKEEWINDLEKLIKDTQLRQQMGASGRKKIEQFYSVESNTNNFLSLFS